jgi:hypothetical protein
VDRDHYYGHEAMKYIFSNPVAYARLSVNRTMIAYSRETIGIVWNEKGLSSKFGQSSLKMLKRISTAYWWIMMTLGFVGAVLIVRRRLASLTWPLLLSAAYFAVFPVLTVAMDRYHVPIDPMLAIFASYALLDWRSSPKVQHAETQ